MVPTECHHYSPRWQHMSICIMMALVVTYRRTSVELRTLMQRSQHPPRILTLYFLHTAMRTLMSPVRRWGVCRDDFFSKKKLSVLQGILAPLLTTGALKQALGIETLRYEHSVIVPTASALKLTLGPLRLTWFWCRYSVLVQLEDDGRTVQDPIADRPTLAHGNTASKLPARGE